MIRLYIAGHLPAERLRGVNTPKRLFGAAMRKAIRNGQLITTGVQYAFRRPGGQWVRLYDKSVRRAVYLLRRLNIQSEEFITARHFRVARFFRA